jgi:hypothetical protein
MSSQSHCDPNKSGWRPRPRVSGVYRGVAAETPLDGLPTRPRSGGVLRRGASPRWMPDWALSLCARSARLLTRPKRRGRAVACPFCSDRGLCSQCRPGGIRAEPSASSSAARSAGAGTGPRRARSVTTFSNYATGRCAGGSWRLPSRARPRAFTSSLELMTRFANNCWTDSQGRRTIATTPKPGADT